MSAPKHYATAEHLAKGVNKKYEHEVVDAIRHGWPDESAEADGTEENALTHYLEHNRPALHAWRSGALGDGLEYAVGTSEGPSLMTLQVLTRLVQLDARFLEHEGREDEALETLTLLLRFSRHVSGGDQADQIRAARARYVERAASEKILELALRSACSDDAWHAALDRLEEHVLGHTPFDTVFKNDYRQLLDVMRSDYEEQDIWKQPFTQRVHATAGEMLAEFTPLCAEAWSTGDVTCFEGAIAQLSDEAESRSRIGVVINEDKLVRAQASLVLAISLPTAVRSLRDSLEDLARLEMLRTRIAWHLHESGTGRPPTSLDALVPDLLEAVPRDPFEPAEALRVAHGLDGWWLYSVGPDGEDQGGSVDFRESGESGDLLLRPTSMLKLDD